MWRNPEIDVEKPIICTSKILLYFYGKACPDNVYNIKKIIHNVYFLLNIIPTKMHIVPKTCPNTKVSPNNIYANIRENTGNKY